VVGLDGGWSCCSPIPSGAGQLEKREGISAACESHSSSLFSHLPRWLGGCCLEARQQVGVIKSKFYQKEEVKNTGLAVLCTTITNQRTRTKRKAKPLIYETMQHKEMPSDTTRPRSCSKGEELWQIHLQRSAAASKNGAEDDDHDYPEPRHPKRSIGEELFEVHLKRSKGLEPDYDADETSEKKVNAVGK